MTVQFVTFWYKLGIYLVRGDEGSDVFSRDLGGGRLELGHILFQLDDSHAWQLRFLNINSH